MMLNSGRVYKETIPNRQRLNSYIIIKNRYLSILYFYGYILPQYRPVKSGRYGNENGHCPNRRNCARTIGVSLSMGLRHDPSDRQLRQFYLESVAFSL